MKNGPTRQMDIANALGVSVNTVSHALRDIPDISPEMTKKIKEKALEMGYVPNSMAVSLKTGSSKLIALVYDNLTNPFFYLVSEKICRLTKERGYDTFIYPSNSFLLQPQSFNDLLALQVDGIFSFLDIDEKIIGTKAFEGSNTVIVGRQSHDNISCVFIDDYHGGQLVGEYFNSKGYKNAIYIGPDFIKESSNRYEGLKNTFAGEKLYKKNYSEGYDIGDIINYIKDNNITAVFCFNDFIAINTKGYFDANEVEVVGFDALSRHLSFIDDITSIGIDLDQLAEQSINIMFDKIKGNNVNKHIKIPVSLFVKGEKK